MTGWLLGASNLNLLMATVHSKYKCSLIERVLDSDSNKPFLISIKEREPSEKDDPKKRVTHDDVHIA